jgi:uncharacterized protein
MPVTPTYPAGILAKTDMARGVWKAPAGIDAALSGTQALQVKLTDAENGMPNPRSSCYARTSGHWARVTTLARSGYRRLTRSVY